jgi:hypothetical protein
MMFQSKRAHVSYYLLVVLLFLFALFYFHPLPSPVTGLRTKPKTGSTLRPNINPAQAAGNSTLGVSMIGFQFP